MNKFDLNMVGIKCPDFGNGLRAFIRKSDVPSGSTLIIHADAHNAKRDIVRLCEFGGHTLESVTEAGSRFTFTVIKGGE